MMFRDTTLHSDIARRDREARGLVYRLEKQEEKQVKKFENETKDALIDYYNKAYGSKFLITILNTVFSLSVKPIEIHFESK